MFSFFVRLALLIAACLVIAHGYPRLMDKHKWSSIMVKSRPVRDGDVVFDDLNLADGNDFESVENNDFPEWLFRSRKFCCAPPL